jgi:hypothetical protein
MKYELAIQKDGVLSFAAKWMDLEDIMLSEIRQTQMNTAYSLSYVDGKRVDLNVE